MIATALDTANNVASAVVTAPGKINLTLDVSGVRPDGYHDLRSLVLGIDLCDRIIGTTQNDPGVTIVCEDRRLCGPENLAARAARRLAEFRGREPNLRIELHKSIPVGGGLGGGSSDAAATLRLCNHLWKTGLDRAALARIGAELGSDVPFFFSLPAAIIRRRGEQVEPVKLGWSGWVLLVFVDKMVCTADVYRSWRPSDSVGQPREMDASMVEVSSGDDLTAMLSNHLEAAVFRVCPEIGRVRQAIDGLGIGSLRVSGAGSTLFRLFDEVGAARDAAKRIRSAGINVTTSVVAAPERESSVIVKEP